MLAAFNTGQRPALALGLASISPREYCIQMGAVQSRPFVLTAIALVRMCLCQAVDPEPVSTGGIHDSNTGSGTNPTLPSDVEHAATTIDPEPPTRAVGTGPPSAAVALTPPAIDQPLETASLEPPATAVSTHAPDIINSNSNVNEVSGPANIVNSNPNLLLSSSPGAIINYSLITNFLGSAPDSSEVIQATIATALKERYVPHAVYDAQLGKGCMTGTRVQVLQSIDNWILDLAGQQIFWLAGMAGSGKTAIAQTVCSRVREGKSVVLGGSFFCSRSTGSAAQRDVRCVVPTLAQLLARQSTEFSEALAAELKRDPDILRKQIGVQVKKLLYTPLLALKESPIPILFVIDALDECGSQPIEEDPDNSESHCIVSEMLEALVDFTRESANLPIKFLVTSRPETHIRDTPVSDDTFSSVLHLHTVNQEQVTADIRLYIETRLSSSTKLRARFTDVDVGMLARLSDGLFIFASTALAHILGGGIDAATNRFRNLLNSAQDGLSSRAAAPLDRMYSFILEDAASSAGQTHADELQAMLDLLASILSARMTLSIAALADLLDMDSEDVRARLSRLHAIVYVPDEDHDPSMRTLHASFGDYLLGRASSNIRISASLGHNLLSRGCLRVMAKRLHFNVSQSHSSYESNQEKRPETIPLSLEYACLQWIRHVATLPVPSEFDVEIDGVFTSRFLFWLEVMSVLGEVWRAASILFTASFTVGLPHLSAFLRDANAFVTSSHKAIERSAPHIYLSALPFAPKDSLVYRTFAPLCIGLVSVETFGIDRHGEHLIMTLTGHEKSVVSVAYSPDGRLIGSGSRDGTVRIWDTRTGEETMTPLRSGDGAVRSVAFSPDGRSIAAGIKRHVCIWSLLTGQATRRQLTGHKGSVLSVTFSSDGGLLASASADSSVRLWNPGTGVLVAVLRGHEKAVEAVSFCPAGATLASASADRTIRLWHVSSGKSAGCLTGGEPEYDKNDSDDYSSDDSDDDSDDSDDDRDDSEDDSDDDRDDYYGEPVRNICISPDGTTLASGHRRSLIELWDLRTRRVVSTLRGHSGRIRCVQFSPDGRYVVSASDDGTLRIWTVPRDTADVSSIVLEGHTDLVRSASFSPDGLYIASASDDCTIRIWNAGSGQQGLQPLPTHASSINSVAVSPCGGFIVSGSHDRSVRVWNMRTGEPRFEPLLGHTEGVRSVAISLDGCLIASASGDRTIRLWDARTGGAVGDPLAGHEDNVNAVAFSSDMRWLASGSEDRTVRIWDVATRHPSNIAPLRCSDWVGTVAFSPDSRLLAAGDDYGYISLWHATTGQSVYEPLRETGTSIKSIAFSSDGARIVAGGFDVKVRVWDVNTRQTLLLLESYTRNVQLANVSFNGDLICIGTTDQPVRLWSAATGTLIATLHGHTAWVEDVALTPNGRSVVSCSRDMTIRVWDVDAARLLSSNSASDPAAASAATATLASATLKDGWLVGPSGELLVWVPGIYRRYLQLPPCTMRIGRRRIAVTVGDDGWHLGANWTSCWRKDTLSPVARIM